MVLSFVICALGPILEVTALVLLLRSGLWRIYSAFFAYAVWILIGNSTLLIADLYFRPIYAGIYWHVDSIDVVLRLLVVWEVFRQTFPKGSKLNRSFSKGLGILAIALLSIACVSFLDQSYAGLRSLHLALDRSFGVVQALMVLGTLVVARYYGVICGRNIRGIAYGFGAWASISTANNALVDLNGSFRPYGDYLRPLSYALMLGVWVWALLVYEPNPPILESEGLELNHWNEEWNRTISVARTIIRP